MIKPRAILNKRLHTLLIKGCTVFTKENDRVNLHSYHVHLFGELMPLDETIERLSLYLNNDDALRLESKIHAKHEIRGFKKLINPYRPINHLEKLRVLEDYNRAFTDREKLTLSKEDVRLMISLLNKLDEGCFRTLNHQSHLRKLNYEENKKRDYDYFANEYGSQS